MASGQMTVPLGHGVIEKAQIVSVLDTLFANQTSRGKYTARLEKMIAERCGRKRAVFMASGTCALHIGLECLKRAHGWPEGSNVVVPATTFIASVASIIHAGLTPILCDVFPDDFNIDVDKCWQVAEESHAVAIMPVHLLGRPCFMDALIEISDSLHIPLIEDCCEAFGVTCMGEPVGAFGEVAAVSTYVSHHLSTGTGGALVTDDDWIADKAWSLMQHGYAGPHVFDDWGYSFRSTEMEAALGVAALEDDCTWIARQYGRLLTAHAIDRELRQFAPRIKPQVWNSGEVPMFAPIVCDTEETRDGLKAAFQEAGIETRPLMPLVTQAPVLKMLAAQGKLPGDYPVSLELTKVAFLIGCHPGMDMTHVEYIRSTAEAYFARGHE